MSVITKLAEEVINMGDLAQAIVSLGRIAERRRGARADLIEATNTIADAIREELRTGDAVEIERHAQEFLSGLIYAPGKATYRATKVTLLSPPGRAADVLVRITEKTVAIFGTHGPIAPDQQADDLDFHTATEEERQAFVQEASGVVAAFRRLLEQQASNYEAAAKKAAKLTPR